MSSLQPVSGQILLADHDPHTQAATQVPHSIPAISGKDGHVLLEKYRALLQKFGA